MIVRLVLGTLLVVTALLKMSGGSGEALRSALPFVSPRLYASGVMAEFILGVWLLSGLAPAWSWLCALGFFGLLAVLSFQLGVAGQASCGCLGKVPVSPWWAFAVDVVAVGLLSYFYRTTRLPHRREGSSIVEQRSTTHFIGFICGTSGLLIVILFFSHEQYDNVTVTPPTIRLGSVQALQEVHFRLVIANRSDRDVWIAGFHTDCFCVAHTDRLPAILPAGMDHVSTLSIRAPARPGTFRRLLTAYIGDGVTRQLRCTVIGNVEEPIERALSTDSITTNLTLVLGDTNVVKWY